jgi:hypothetical protein
MKGAPSRERGGGGRAGKLENMNYIITEDHRGINMMLYSLKLPRGLLVVEDKTTCHIKATHIPRVRLLGLPTFVR